MQEWRLRNMASTIIVKGQGSPEKLLTRRPCSSTG